MGIATQVKRFFRRARIMKKVKYYKRPTVDSSAKALKEANLFHSYTAKKYESQLKSLEDLAKNSKSPAERKLIEGRIKATTSAREKHLQWIAAAKLIEKKRAEKIEQDKLN